MAQCFENKVFFYFFIDTYNQVATYPQMHDAILAILKKFQTNLIRRLCDQTDGQF